MLSIISKCFINAFCPLTTSLFNKHSTICFVGTKLAGQNAFVCGVRRKDCELFAVTYEDGEYKVTMIEKGVGPANLCVVNEKDRDIIVAANHTANEAAVYFVTE